MMRHQAVGVLEDDVHTGFGKLVSRLTTTDVSLYWRYLKHPTGTVRGVDCWTVASMVTSLPNQCHWATGMPHCRFRFSWSKIHQVSIIPQSVFQVYKLVSSAIKIPKLSKKKIPKLSKHIFRFSNLSKSGNQMPRNTCTITNIRWLRRQWAMRKHCHHSSTTTYEKF
jgi:hypothetical protein